MSEYIQLYPPSDVINTYKLGYTPVPPVTLPASPPPWHRPATLPRCVRSPGPVAPEAAPWPLPWELDGFYEILRDFNGIHIGIYEILLGFQDFMEL